jgi:hypothetical protein
MPLCVSLPTDRNPCSFDSSLVQFRNRRFGLLERRSIQQILRISGLQGWLLLRGQDSALFMPDETHTHLLLSVGEMLLYTVLACRFLPRRIRYISSMKSDTATNPSNTARREMCMLLVSAGAMRMTTLIIIGSYLFSIARGLGF